MSRDAAPDGRFVYAAVTTGIYCRPSCPTPTPLRRKVRFFPDPAAAEAAGFCACKRCRPTLASPLAWHVAAVGKACAILSTSERAPSLAADADAVGIKMRDADVVAAAGAILERSWSSNRWRAAADGCRVDRGY